MSQETVERLQRNSRFLINVGEDLEEINSLLASRINLHTRAEPAGWPT